MCIAITKPTKVVILATFMYMQTINNYTYFLIGISNVYFECSIRVFMF